jgi:hypothetical protein
VTAEATASTHVNRAASADGAACTAAEKNKVAKYKEVMRLLPTAQFIPFIMAANGRLGKEAQKLLIALSCAIVRMEKNLRLTLNIQKELTHSGLQLERRSISGCVDNCPLLVRSVTR